MDDLGSSSSVDILEQDMEREYNFTIVVGYNGSDVPSRYEVTSHVSFLVFLAGQFVVWIKRESPYNRTCGTLSLVPVLDTRLPHVHRTCGCVVILPHNHTCGVASLVVGVMRD